MSSKQWYYMQNGQSNGPVSEENIVSMVREGVLPKTGLIWTKGSANWRAAESFFKFEEDAPPPIPEIRPISSTQEAAAVLAAYKPLPKQVWADTAPHPWRRFFARLLDAYINGFIAIYILSLFLTIIDPTLAKDLINSFEGPSGRFWDIIATPFFAMFVNAALIGITGSSLGKWIFGIRVANQQNKPIGYFSALKRETKVWYSGLALGIPLFSLFTMSAAQKVLLEEGKTTWDKEMNLNIIYRESGARQSALSLFGVLIIVFISAILRTQ